MKSEDDPASYLARWTASLETILSKNELDSLVRVFGSTGINTLCDMMINNFGAASQIQELKALSVQVATNKDKPGTDVARLYGDILSVGIKIGCFFAARNLLLEALERVSKTRMPFMHSVISNTSNPVGKYFM